MDFSVKAAACPTVLADSTGPVWALCTCPPPTTRSTPPSAPPVFGLTGAAFDSATIDAATGAVASRNRIAHTPVKDTLEMVGTITPDGVWWQGAVTGVYRME